MPRRRLGSALPVLFLCFALVFPPVSCVAGSSDSIILEGKVVDASTGHPVRNATVEVWDTTPMSQSLWRQVQVQQTSTDGSYSVTFSKGFKCRVYAYFDDLYSPGFDYIPCFQDFDLTGEKNLIFSLKPGGSIIVEGELRFVEATRNPDYFEFTVVDPDTGSRPHEEGYVYDYGTEPFHNFLQLSSRHVIVPADTPVNILLNASIFIVNKREYRTLLLGTLEPFILSMGQETKLRIEEPLSRFNLVTVQNCTNLAEKKLNEVEQRGFYITLERNDLAKAKDLVHKAQRELEAKSLDESHADLREAYVATLQIERRINDMYVDASSSVTLLILFLSLTAVVLSSFLFEHGPVKILATCLFSVPFFAMLYYAYPGVKLLQTSYFVIYIGLALAIVFSMFFVLPFLVDEKIVSIFSMAKKNLRRRRTRFMLTLISVIVLAMSFVTLTSFSTSYGLTSQPLQASNLEGLLIRRPRTANLPATITYLPMDVSAISWLQSKPQVSLVSPKFENIPWIQNIGALSSSKDHSKKLTLFGAVGIQPSLEAGIIRLDSTIAQGEYLQDNDKYGILISTNAAKQLNADIGDKLLLSSGLSTTGVSIVGFFEDKRLAQIKDIDGEFWMPRKLVMIEGEIPTVDVRLCDPAEMVITNWQTARELFPLVSLSRVDIQLSDVSLTPTLARQIALERDFWVWSSFRGYMSRIGLEEYSEAKGLSVMIPWIIVILNVVVTMWNAVFERKKEITILSSVGLNPSYIGGLFFAEAAVVGLAGGGIGYLLGLVGYKVMPVLSLAVEVQQKVSAFWSLASLGIAVSAVLVGTGLAVKNSVILTPSLLRRWTEGENVRDTGALLELKMPIRLLESEVNSLFEHMKLSIQDNVLRMHSSISESLVARMTKESVTVSEVSQTRTIVFQYAFGQRDPIGSFPFDLVAERRKIENYYTTKLVCRSGDMERVKEVATFIRMLIVDWSAQNK